MFWGGLVNKNYVCVVSMKKSVFLKRLINIEISLTTLIIRREGRLVMVFKKSIALILIVGIIFPIVEFLFGKLFVSGTVEHIA